MIKNAVKNSISKVLGKDSFTLLIPARFEYGDYALHVGYTTQKNQDKSIQNIISKLSQDKLFERVEKKGEFINFFVSTQALVDELNSILSKQEKYTTIKPNGQMLILEFGQPNTHKLPHIGHLFSYIYGESLARLLEIQGRTVIRANYQGDVGLHVAKCLSQVKNSKLKIKNSNTPEEKIQFLQKCYQDGAMAYDADSTAKSDIDELNKKIYEQDSSIKPLWKQTRQWSLDYYKAFETRLGITFDKYYFESQTAPIGKKLVEDNTPSIFQRSKGAIIFPGERLGLHNRVFITSQQNPTYEAKDLGLMALKLKDFAFDRAIITTASEQNAYFKVVIKAIEEVFPEARDKVSHIGFGMIGLKGKKLSSRTGEIISAIDLANTVKEQVKKINSDDRVAEAVALAAIKYGFLKSEAKKDIVFDIKQSVSTEGNSGPYLLYTFARTQSVLNKSQVEKHPGGGRLVPRSLGEAGTDSPEVLYKREELNLLRALPRFPEVVKSAAERRAPHLVCTYLYALAQTYSRFYETCPILKAENDIKPLRLALNSATGHILKNGLRLLGIETLDKI